MYDIYVQHRLYLEEIVRLKNGTGLEMVPVNFNYQGLIIVDTGLLEHAGSRFAFQTHSCGCGPQPTIWGVYLEEVIPWQASELCAWFAASRKAKDRELVEQTVVADVYRVRLPANETERSEVAAALHSRFGADKKISFF